MSRLQGVVAALERAQLLVEMPDLHTWPEITGLTADSRKVEREQPVDVPQILVRDGRRAAAVAAEAWYDGPAAKLDLVGVTGTNGKTTSVTLLRHVLSALEPTGSIGTLGAFDPAGDSASAGSTVTLFADPYAAARVRPRGPATPRRGTRR